MIKALRVVMIVWAIIMILYGLAFIFVPEQLGAMSGFEKGPAYVGYLAALLGVSWIVPAVFVIIAATGPAEKHYVGKICHGIASSRSCRRCVLTLAGFY